jgi:hypothetical protein
MSRDPAVTASRTVKINGLFEALEKALTNLLFEAEARIKLTHGSVHVLLSTVAFKESGTQPIFLTLFDERSFPVITLAADRSFYVTAAGAFMQLPKGELSAALNTSDVDENLLSAAREVLSIMICQLALALRTALGDTKLDFPRQEFNVTGKLPRAAMLILRAEAEINGAPSGQIQLWLPDALVAKLK